MSDNPKYTYTIEPCINPDLTRLGFAWVAYQHGFYDRNSVLAGQPFKQTLDHYRTLEAARADHPTARLLADNTGQPPAHIPSVAPDWFDEANAGEHWNEDY